MFTRFLAAAALSLAASTATAGPTGVYAGVSGGVLHADELDGDKSHFGGFVGYGFNQTFAFEVAYRHYGDWEYQRTDAKLKQTDFTVVGSVPLGRNVDLFARVGYVYAKVESDLARARDDDDIDSGVYGIGLAYRFTPNLSARAELQQPIGTGTSIGASLLWQF